MCNANENKNAAYVLLQHMMTPFEKSLLIELKDAKSTYYLFNEYIKF